jgi:hypothetical protein
MSIRSTGRAPSFRFRIALACEVAVAIAFGSASVSLALLPWFLNLYSILQRPPQLDRTGQSLSIRVK